LTTDKVHEAFFPQKEIQENIEPKKPQDQSIFQKLKQLKNISILKDMKTRKEEIEKEIYSFLLDKDLIEQFKNILNDEGKDISVIFEEYMKQYCKSRKYMYQDRELIKR